MKAFPPVDVIIPVYDRDELLMDALHSVLNQNYPNISLYIIEDGSRCLQNRLAFFKKFKNVFYTRLPRHYGVSYCRNFGALSGGGKYTAFLDSDDLWTPAKVEKQVEFLENHPEYKWVHTHEVWVKNGSIISQKKEHRKQGGFFFEKLLERCLISPSSVFFRRDFFLENGGFNPVFPVAEDYELWLRLNLKNPVGYLDEALTIKRAGPWSQLSQTVEIDKWRVLGLHRIFRLFKNDDAFQPFKPLWKSVIQKKINILEKGAEKYKRSDKVKKYQSWSKVFSTF